MLSIYGIFSSGMVLQRNAVNCINGKSENNGKIKVCFRNKEYIENCDENGEFKIEFDGGKEGGPFELSVCNDKDKIVFSDIMVGDVWLVSGQSNAQLPMERLKYKFPEEVKNPCSDVRMITIPITYSFDSEKKSVEKPQWKTADKDSIYEMSGTGYFFGKQLTKELNIPIGIVNASQGGCNIISWMNEESLNELGKKDYCERIEKWKNHNRIEETIKNTAEAQKKWDENLLSIDKGLKENWQNLKFEELSSDWKECLIPSDFRELGKKGGVYWYKKEINLTKEQLESFKKDNPKVWVGTIQDADKVWINDSFIGETPYCYPPRRYSACDKVFKEGRNTITIRVQKNGAWDVRFFEDKPYYIFNEETKIPLDGEWKYCISCECDAAPAQMFFEWEPSSLYNSMLAPCFNTPIRGAVWYQGESNCWIPGEYKELLQKMIYLWREKFEYAVKDFPFIIAQLPNWAEGYRNETNKGGGWPELREQQLNAFNEITNTGLAVLIDCGEWNDLHPEDKETVGKRCAFEALRLFYGKKNYSYAPKCEYCEKNGRILKLRFDCASSHLVNKCSGTKEINGFEFLTKKDEILEAKANLVSDTDVEIYLSDKTCDIKELRYLWKQNPYDVTLYNAQGIPVSPFRISL
ncbi:MAG: hypothetical protein IKX23_07225 [Treponema sp.]|nr:hypothetical protein [Treponema sp.]